MTKCIYLVPLQVLLIMHSCSNKNMMWSLLCSPVVLWTLCVFVSSLQESFSRTTPQPKAVSPSTNHDEELQRILLRRRDVLESQHNNGKFVLLHFTPSVSWSASTSWTETWQNADESCWRAVCLVHLCFHLIIMDSSCVCVCVCHFVIFCVFLVVFTCSCALSCCNTITSFHHGLHCILMAQSQHQHANLLQWVKVVCLSECWSLCRSPSRPVPCSVNGATRLSLAWTSLYTLSM